MALSKSKSKSKSKSSSKSNVNFPADSWEDEMEAVAELPYFFENSAWRELTIEDPPDPEETRLELDALLEKQKFLENDRNERERRKAEIELEAAGESPNFNRILLFYPHPASYILMQAMLEVGRIVAVHYKKRFMRPRPSQLEPRLRPMIDVPRHASYPSGHSLQYHLVSKALASVVGSHEIGEQLSEIAKRVAQNREYAGLHYESDTEVGKKIAFAIFPQVQEAFTETFAEAASEWR